MAQEIKQEIRLRKAAPPRPHKDALLGRLAEVEAEMTRLRARRSKLWSEMSDPGLSEQERELLSRQCADATRALNGHSADMGIYDRQRWPAMLTGGSGLSEERRWYQANLLVTEGRHPSQIR